MKKLLTVLCMVGLTALCSCGEGKVEEPIIRLEEETIIEETILTETIITEIVITETIIEETTIVETTTEVKIPDGMVMLEDGRIFRRDCI